MSHQFITTEPELSRFCASLRDAPWIGFDTEFVSEHTYRPVLCLLQVIGPGQLAIVDCLAVGNLLPFWELIAAPGHETIVHAGRGEVGFCLDAVGRPPEGLFDVQLAAALVATEYPAGYGNLLQRFLGRTPRKGETRTDWRRRPLSAAQLDYALEDVRHLPDLREAIGRQLAERGRTAWFETEMRSWLDEVEASRQRPRWRKVSGISGLGARELSIVREVWHWREDEAARRDWPPKRVLRDDLIVELARRRSADPKQITAVRGMERGDLRRFLPELSRRVEQALAAPLDELRGGPRRDASPQLNMIAQFLASALTSCCRAQQVAASLVGTAEDVRELINFRLFDETARDGQPPVLTQGWRAELVGQLLDDLLSGRVAIRIADPGGEQPLSFERWNSGPAAE